MGLHLRAFPRVRVKTVLERLPSYTFVHVQVQKILERTMSRLPLFKSIDPDLRIGLFPLLRPLSFQPNDVIFHKGDASRELLFLLDGEVDVLDPVDNSTQLRTLCKGRSGLTEQWVEELVSHRPLASKESIPSFGTLGETVLLGQRQPMTLV